MLRRQANGIWHVDFQLLGTRIHRSARTRSKRKAEAFERRLREQLADQRLGGPTRERVTLTLGQALDRYVGEHLEPHAKSAANLLKDQSVLRRVQAALGGPQVPLQAIDSRAVSDLKSTLTKAGASRATVNRHLALTRAVIRKADREWRALTADPTFELYRLRNARTRVLTRTEEARLLVAVRTNLTLHRLIVFLLGTGARLGEALSLTWDRVAMRPNPTATFSETKNGQTRSVPLPPSVSEMLLSLAETATHVQVFVGRRGPLKNPGPSFRRACNRAGIEDLRLHDLRHTYASRLVREGVSLLKVARLLGHRSTRMTERYAHLQPSDLHDLASLVDRRRAAIPAQTVEGDTTQRVSP